MKPRSGFVDFIACAASTVVIGGENCVLIDEISEIPRLS